MKRVLHCVLIPALFGFNTILAADYQGADAILKNVTKEQESAAGHGNDTEAKIREDLKAFRDTSAKLQPEEAASRWLELLDRWLNLPGAQQSSNQFPADDLYEGQLSLQILASVPPPAAWPVLSAKAALRSGSNDRKGRRNILIRLIADRLNGDGQALTRDLASLDSLLEKERPLKTFTDQLRHELLQQSDDVPALLDYLHQQLEDKSQNAINIPDLVSIAGKEKAEELLTEALQSKDQIIMERGDETRALARHLALANVDKLKAPQWGRVSSIEPDSIALYEALEKRQFTQDNSGERTQAGAYYLLGLIASHRTTEALAFAGKLDQSGMSLPYQAIEALKQAGFNTELADFLHDLLAKNPDLPLWDEYVELATEIGQQDKMVKLAEESAARQGLDDHNRLNILHYLRRAYLAVDRIDDGLSVLQKEISGAEGLQDYGKLFEAGFDEAVLGRLLNRKGLLDEGLRTAKQALDKKSEIDSVENLVGLLIETGRGPEAEALLGKQLAITGQEANPVNCLALLAYLYHIAQRSDDVIYLLDHSTQWGAKDLQQVLDTQITINRNEEYLAWLAANALAARNRKPEALKILNALMDEEGDYDPAYELFITLVPREQAIARLDELFARDRNESRPLIWKAKLLFDARKLEEAESVGRQAVTVDPSDGEHGPGRRMRVYAVLADIREARGDKKEAETFRGAVTAIRHSEEADRFYNAGLITKAIKMYEEALTHFDDAYCIQSRLALRMVEAGDVAGAEEHYQRAYELMPDSFGRVESHCFGCERAFKGARAQSIAEKVFTKIAAERPDKPQVHYLLGYLRNEEGRYREALPEFQEAVKLDPDYLNAWKEIGGIGERMDLPIALRDSIQLNTLRLDPLGRHTSFDFRSIGDLKAAWLALQAAAKVAPAPPGPIYALAASARQANAQGADESESLISKRRELDPGRVVSENQFIAVLLQILQSTTYSSMLQAF